MRRRFRHNLVQFSSTLALANVHRAPLPTWLIISFRIPVALLWTRLSTLLSPLRGPLASVSYDITGMYPFGCL